MFIQQDMRPVAPGGGDFEERCPHCGSTESSCDSPLEASVCGVEADLASPDEDDQLH